MLAVLASATQASTMLNWGSNAPRLWAPTPFHWDVIPPTIANPSADGKPGTLEQLWGDGNDTLKTVLVAYQSGTSFDLPTSYSMFLTEVGASEGALLEMDWIDISEGSVLKDSYRLSQDLFVNSIPVGYDYIFVSFALNDGDGSVLWHSDSYTAAQLNPYMYNPYQLEPGAELPVLNLYPSWGAVPEPTTGLLVLAGTGMLLLRRRARKA